MQTACHEGRRRFAALTAAMTLVLILAGGFVTTTNTGDTIVTWPHWGRIQGGAWVEAGHRTLAVLVGLLVAGLALWLHLRDPRAWVRRLALVALAAVCVQALLGGLRVGKYFPTPTAIVHATLAQVIFCAVVATGLFVSRAWDRTVLDPGARRLGVVATGAAFLQIVAGAVTRHTGAGLELHLAGAGAVLLLASLLGSRLVMTPLRRGGHFLMGVLGAQFALGLATWKITRADFVRSVDASLVSIVTISAHVAMGAMVLATCLILTLRCSRPATAFVPALEPARI